MLHGTRAAGQNPEWATVADLRFHYVLLVAPATHVIESPGEPRLGFGAAPIGNLGRAVTEEAAQAAVDAAWACGVRYFDTAPHYGLGLSEQRLGAALADRPRAAYRLSTKVGRRLVPNNAPTGSDLADGGFDVPDTVVRHRDYTGDGIRRSLEESLTRLRTDRIDLALVHDPDDHLGQAIREAIPALAALREEGMVGAIGVGMNQWQAPLRILAESEHRIDAVMIAGRWTLLDRSAAPLLQRCERENVAVVAAAPFHSGILATDNPGRASLFGYRPAAPEVLAVVRRIGDACRAHGTTVPAAALQFPLRAAVVTSVVAGFRTDAEVFDAVARLDDPIPDALWSDVEQILATA